MEKREERKNKGRVEGRDKREAGRPGKKDQCRVIRRVIGCTKAFAWLNVSLKVTRHVVSQY